MLDAQLGLACGFGKDSSLSNEDNMFARKLLLEFTYETGLDLLERPELGHRHENDDGLLATNVNLLGSVDVKFTKLSFQVGVKLQVEKSMSDRVFKLVGLLTGRLDDLGC